MSLLSICIIFFISLKRLSNILISFTERQQPFAILRFLDALIISGFERSFAVIEEIIAANTGKSVEEIHSACERDNYMTAQEALEFGLIDKVITKR